MEDNAKGFPPDDMGKRYEEDWREYKRIRNRFLLLFVTCVPVCFGLGFVSVKLHGTFAPFFVASAL